MTRGSHIILSLAILEGIALALGLWVILPLFWDPPPLLQIGIYSLWLIYEVVTFTLKKRVMDQPPIAGADKLLGQTGISLTPLQPEGQIRVRNEIWHAKTQSGQTLNQGQGIVVVGREGTLLLVEQPESN